MVEGAVGRGKKAAVKDRPAINNLREPAKNSVEIMVGKTVYCAAHKAAGNNNGNKKIESPGRGGQSIDLLRRFFSDIIWDLAQESVPCAEVQEYQIRQRDRKGAE